MKNQNKNDGIQKGALGGQVSTSFQKLIVTPVTVQLEQAPGKTKVKFGICADMHQYFMNDGESRLQVFIDHMQKQDVDFIIELGYLWYPFERDFPFLKIWEHFKGPRYHVLGHYDMNGELAHSQAMAFWKTYYKYYSFDNNGYHFVVLNGNEHNTSANRAMGYARYIGKEQQEWLKNDLQRTTLPTILFCHQRLDNNSKGIENASKIRLILEHANHNAGFKKVRLVFSGHHMDHQNEIKGISYIQVNSMSYQWLGNSCVKFRYSIEIDKKYPNINHAAPCKDTAFTRAETDNYDMSSLKVHASFVRQQKG